MTAKPPTHDELTAAMKVMVANTTLDAAIEAALDAIAYGEGKVIATKFFRIALAKLIEGMGPPSLLAEHNSSMAAGIDLALTEIRRRAGIEGGES